MDTRRRLWHSGVAGLFYLLYFLYVWLVIDPRLVLHSLGILMPYRLFSFQTGWPFFVEHLSHVGGLVDYAARLLTQFYGFGWAGALLIVAAAWCMGCFTDWLARRGGRDGGGVLRYFAAAIVLVMYCGYSHPLVPVLSLLAALGGFALYARLAPQGTIQRTAVLLIASVILYLAAGAGSLLFPVLVAVDELLIGRRESVAATSVACAAVIPVAAAAVFGLELKETYAGFVVSAPGVAPECGSYTLALYLFFPTVLAGSVLWGNSGVGDATPGAKATPSAALKRISRSRPLPTAITAMAVVFCGIGVAAWFSLDSRTRAVLETDYYAQQEQWREVLRSAERLPEGIYNLRCTRNIMQALFHTGRLADEMFRYPQRRGVNLFFPPAEQRDLGSYFQESRLFLDMGQVNMAERCAYEAVATTGEQPAILKHLALIYVLKGRPEAARVCLNALARHPFHRRAAGEMLRRIEADPALENDPRASRIRANMALRDAIAQEMDAEDFLHILLESNPQNKMAFELLMAHYLCEGRPDKVVANLPRLKAFSYSRVPRYFQEAAAIDALLSNRPPAAGVGEIDPAVLRQVWNFQRITSSGTNRQDALKSVLEAGLGDSYFFYLVNGVSRR